MPTPRNRAVLLTDFGGSEKLQIVDVPLPSAARGEVRIRVLASGLEYTDVVIRRHLYPQTMFLRPPFVMGYDVVGQIDQVGPNVTSFQIGERVADITVVGSNTAYRTLGIEHLARVPTGVDPIEAAAMVLSWTTAFQLLHRTAVVQPSQRVLVHGAAGAVGQALLVLGKLAGLEIWGTARAEHGALVRELGAVPIDYQREDFTRVLAGGFDVVFDGVGEDYYRRSFAALQPDGVLCAYGYTSAVKPSQRLTSLLLRMFAVYLSRHLLSWQEGNRRLKVYSINVMRARHPAWFRDDVEKLLGLLASGIISPRIAGRISLEQVPEAHRRLEEGGLQGKLVLCP